MPTSIGAGSPCADRAPATIHPHHAPSRPPATTVRLLVTAYDTCTPESVGHWAYEPGPRVTASGTSIYTPGIAAAWSLFPPGTKITLPHFGTYKVDDNGGMLRRDAKRKIPHVDLRITPTRNAKNPFAACQAAHNHANAIGRYWTIANVEWPRVR